jgi:hypothetical protein
MLHWSVVLSLCCLIASSVSNASNEQTSPITTESQKSYLRNHELEDRTLAVSAVRLPIPRRHHRESQLIQSSDRHRKLEEMSDDCLDKMCQMLESVFTCEVSEES